MCVNVEAAGEGLVCRSLANDKARRLRQGNCFVRCLAARDWTLPGGPFRTTWAAGWWLTGDVGDVGDAAARAMVADDSEYSG